MKHADIDGVRHLLWYVFCMCFMTCCNWLQSHWRTDACISSLYWLVKLVPLYGNVVFSAGTGVCFCMPGCSPACSVITVHVCVCLGRAHAGSP